MSCVHFFIPEKLRIKHFVSMLVFNVCLIGWRPGAAGDIRGSLDEASEEVNRFADEFLGDKCISVESKTEVAGVSIPSPSMRVKYDIRHRWMLLQMGGERGESAFGINDDYCFEVFKQRKEKNTTSWMLADCAFYDEPEPDTKKLGLSMSLPRPSLEMYRADFGGLRGIDEAIVGASSLLADESANLQSAKQVEGNLEVSYTRVMKEGAQKGKDISGKLVLSASEHYLPLSLEERIDSGGGGKQVQRSYVFDLPARLRRTQRMEFAGGPNRLLANTTVIETFDVTSMSEEEFTLSAFGLPEPAKLVSRESRVVSWLVVINLGVILIIAYFILRRRALRQNSP